MGLNLKPVVPGTSIVVLEVQVYLSQVLHLFKTPFIDGSQSIFLSFIDGLPVNNKVKFQKIDRVPVTGTPVGFRTVFVC